MSKDIKNTSGSITNVNAVMEGYLMKWANIFSRYHKYLFWIEEGFLKYVSEDKRKNRKGARCIPLANAFVESDEKSKRKFKVFTAKDKIRLRAQNQVDRD